ncbi:SpoIIE family protein phosphatase [Streptomyces sp. NPDC056600]|uniref:SpoIIE family protein phosphatase n=1 Tax=Streptomyces sp. NPDC056600 TaxID=3345874 RepID=UPI0036A75FB9
MADIGTGASAPTVTRTLGTALATVMRDTAASVGMLHLASPEENALRLVTVAGGTTSLLRPWMTIPLDASAPAADAWRRKAFVWLPDQQEMALRYPSIGLIMPYDVMLAALPIVGGTRTWGVLSVLLPVTHAGHLTPAELRSLQDACGSVARVLDEREASGAGLPPLDVIHKVTPLRRDEPAPEAARAAYDALERIPAGVCALDRDGRVVYLNPAAARLLEIDAHTALGHRPDAMLPWLRDPVYEAQYRASVVTRRPVGFNVTTPSGRRLGFLLFAHETGIAVRVMEADMAGEPSLPRNRDPGQPSRIEPGDLYHLTHLSAALAEAASAEHVIRLVREQVVPAFGPTAFVLAKVEEGRLTVLDTAGLNEAGSRHLEGKPLTADEPALRMLTDHRPRFYASVEELCRDLPPSRQVPDGMAAWALMPLVSDGRAMGCLVLGYREPHLFSTAERSLLVSLAGLIALALDRTLVSDTEHRLALDLQSSLLPSRLPEVPGLTFAARYLPSTRGSGIGGDFYDVIRWGDEGAAAVTVGDVQGHDTEAAALMGQVRTAVRAVAGAPPGEVMRRANTLLANLEAERFTSCAYAEFDLPAHQVRMVTAGHVPALLRRLDGRTGTVELPQGLLLGVESDHVYRTRTLGFDPGSVLALYTDGLVEKPDTEIDASIQELARSLSEADTGDLDGTAESLLRHAHASGPRYDDIALLLIRCDV